MNEMQADPHRSSRKRWMPILGITVVLMAAIVGTFVVVLELGMAPPNSIIDVSQVSDPQYDHLVDADIINPDETVVLFYSSGLASIAESGNLLTENRVISYARSDDRQLVRSASYDHITGVTVLEQGTDHRPTIVGIHTVDGRHIHVSLAANEGRDREFVDEIRRRLPSETTDPVVDRNAASR